MTDDHDRCKWVNVSSGTASPGLSRTKSREPWRRCSKPSTEGTKPTLITNEHKNGLTQKYNLG